jgi:flagellar L-ring protein precursor FlgH
VILCDLIMPVVTGMDLYDELRRTRPALAARVVFMTGGTFTPRTRVYTPGQYAANQAGAQPSAGSLYSEAAPGLLQDARAVRAGDTVVVRIDEQADAQGDASSKLSKSSKRELDATELLGLIPALKKSHPDVDPAKLVALAAQSDFSGDGQTHRKGQLTGNIAVKVRERMPNGDLFIEGTKVVMINQEEYHMYVSGILRPTDIGRDNTASSSRIADAQIEFTGRGDVADQLDRGWLAKILDTISPF